VDNPEVRVTIPFWFKPSGYFSNLTAGDLNAILETDKEFGGISSLRFTQALQTSLSEWLAFLAHNRHALALVSNIGPDIEMQIKRHPGLPEHFKKNT
jgi:hypothetical protein